MRVTEPGLWALLLFFWGGGLFLYKFGAVTECGSGVNLRTEGQHLAQNLLQEVSSETSEKS